MFVGVVVVLWPYYTDIEVGWLSVVITVVSTCNENIIAEAGSNGCKV
jgi:hypothetical protein